MSLFDFDVYASWGLSDDQIDTLSDLLLDCESLTQNSGVRYLIRRLPKSIQHGLISGEASTAIIVEDIVEVCSRYPSGLEVLIETMRRIERGSEQMLAIDRYVEEIRPHTIASISLAELDSLKWLLSRALPTRELLESACLSASGVNDSELPRYVIGDRSTMVAWLAGMGVRGDNKMPIVTLALLAADHIRASSHETAEELRQWAEGAADRLGGSILHSASSHSDGVLHRDHARPRVLLVALVPWPVRRNQPVKYLIRAWRDVSNDGPELLTINPSGTRTQEVDHDEEEVYDWSEVPAKLPLLIAQTRTPVTRVGRQLVLEFMLPDELLGEAIEHWTPEGRNVIGFDYPVVVRPLERMRRPIARDLWESRWHDDHEDRTASDAALTWQSLLEPDGLLSLQFELQNYVCLAWCHAPLRPAEFRKILQVILGAGTPFALLPRENQGSQQSYDSMRLEIATVLEDCPVRELPLRVWKQRRRAWIGKAPPIWKDVSLLWDDPRRCPPEHELVMPSRRGDDSR